MTTPVKVCASDIGLPEAVIRRRRRSRRLATLMLTVALVTAAGGWLLYGNAIFSAIRIQEQPPSRAIIAYGLLIVSSISLVLGLWYLLLAQVERVARMVDAAELEAAPVVCPACRSENDRSQRYCGTCGKALAGEIRQSRV